MDSESDHLLDNGRPPDEDAGERLGRIHLATGTYEDCPAYINQPFNTGVVVALTSITIGLALMLTPVLLENSSHLEITLAKSLCAEKVIIAIATVVVSGWMLYHRNRITLRRNDHSSTNDDSKPLIRTLATFGAGSLLYCILAIVCHMDILVIFQNIAHAIFVLCLLPLFLVSFRPEHTTFKNLPVVHFAFTFLIIVTTWTWIGIAITPMMLIEPYLTELYITRCNVMPIQDNFNETCPVFISGLEKFLDPFYIEFPTIAALCFIGLWITTISHPQSRPLMPHDFTAWRTPESRSLRGTRIVCLISIIVFSVYVGVLRISQYVINNDNVYMEVYTIWKSIYRSVILGSMVVMALKLKSWKDSENFPLSASEAVLILTACSDVLLFSFRFISSAACLHVDNSVTAGASICILYTTLSIVQPMVQTKLFIDLRRKTKPVYAKYWLIFFAAFNFSEWLNRSLDHGISKWGPLAITPFLNALFGQYITRMILLLILPIMSLFRFHSGMVAVELIQQKKCANVMKNED